MIRRSILFLSQVSSSYLKNVDFLTRNVAMDAFASELEKAKDKIASVKSKTFKYGPHERHEVCSVSSTGADKHKLIVFKQKLEVYYPPPSSSS